MSDREGRDSPPEHISASLDRFLEGRGLDEAIRRIGILKAWPGLVGPQIAEATRAVEVQGDVVVVEVASSPWMNELTMIRDRLLRRIHEKWSDAPIGGIRFRLAGMQPAKGAGRGSSQLKGYP